MNDTIVLLPEEKTSLRRYAPNSLLPRTHLPVRAFWHGLPILTPNTCIAQTLACLNVGERSMHNC